MDGDDDGGWMDGWRVMMMVDGWMEGDDDGGWMDEG